MSYDNWKLATPPEYDEPARETDEEPETRPYFAAPTPNCGHGGITFRFIPLACIWMCSTCVASIGPLYETCSSCGGRRPHGQLTDVHKLGRLCFACARDHAAQRQLDR